MISFDVSREDDELLLQIADYAVNFYPAGESKLTALMDLTACHANGCPLDLARMLAAAQEGSGSFAHDAAGIRRHINRKTGKLSDGFLPRFSA